jgi:hypothetical protein
MSNIETTVICPKCDAAFVLKYSPYAREKTHTCSSCGTVIPLPQMTLQNQQPASPLVAPVPSDCRNAMPPILPVSASPVSAANYARPSIPKTSNMAVASMVLGILGLMGGWMCCGLVFPILAIIFGHISYSKISRQPTTLSGKGMAIAGFTMGYVGLMFGLVMIFALGSAAAFLTAVTQELAKQFPQFSPIP